MNHAAITAATHNALAQGIRVLNAFLLADTEAEHVHRLLHLMEPPPGAVVVDAGCGVGEVARLMQAERPDLSFILVNVNASQLAECPERMQQVCADFADLPLADSSVDVVMFNFSLCHAEDWLKTLREAHRVLKPGGILFVFDMARYAGDNELMDRLVAAHAYAPQQIDKVMRRAGFADAIGTYHQPNLTRLRDVFGDEKLYDKAFAGVYPATFRYVRAAAEDTWAATLDRHEHIAFQFSGGADSTAALYLLRPHWSRLTVYHLDTLDQFPETRRVVDLVQAELEAAGGRFVRILSDVRQVRAQHGLPSDLVPVDNAGKVGPLVSGRAVRIQGRYDCCARALMNPMHERMRCDGITLIIRGQRDDEYVTPPKRSGDVEDGIEVLYPVQDWSGEQVRAFLREHLLPIAPFYERGMKRAPECMGCTAWWDEGRGAYMQQWHPEAHAAYSANMKVIRLQIDQQLANL